MESLDLVELEMALEESIDGFENLTATECERLLQDLRQRIDGGELDEGLAILVRKLGPQGPPGKAGAKVRPPGAEV